MTREVPASKPATLWRGDGRWHKTKAGAYYAIAKALVVKRYPPWLDLGQHDDEQCAKWAKENSVRDWQARRDRAVELFWNETGQYFVIERWQRYVRRVARFLAHFDRKAA